MHKIQTDIYSLNEINLDTRNNIVQHTLQQRAKQLDKTINIKMQSSKQSPRIRESVFKPRGTMINTRGYWAGRIINLKNDPTVDTLGRWTLIHLKGKGNTIISIFSFTEFVQMMKERIRCMYSSNMTFMINTM